MIRAQSDSTLTARVARRRSLHYDEGADQLLDRPGHVRAGSGIVRVGDALAIIQDDTSFIALVAGGSVTALPLPAGPSGARQFGEARGNKADKLDLEACIMHETTLVAFGSGSSEKRERIALIYDPFGPAARVHVVEAPELYRSLKAHPEFAGSQLNIEGATANGDVLTLFQRGNGRPRDGRLPRDSTCELSMGELWRYLLAEGECPPVGKVCSYDLGTAGGVRLTFTDATTAPDGRIVFLAAAEASPDTFHDGPVAGVSVGLLAEGTARLTPLLDERGLPLLAKAEGIALWPADPSRADVVVDRDDPDVPCELYEVALTGFF